MKVVFDKCANALDFAIANRSFGVFYSAENTPNTNIHTHECCEILLCLSGGKSFLIDGKLYEVKDGDLFLINQFEAHKITFSPGERAERYVLQIHPQFIFDYSTAETDLSQCLYGKGAGRHHCLHTSGDELENIKSLFRSLRTENGYADDILKRNAVIQLLAQVNILAKSAGGDEVFRLQSQPLRLAMEYINENFQNPINLDIIAKNSYVSVNQLCRLFKSQIGTTVSKYIVGKRISEAKKCLNKGYNVSDTAMMCGFSDYSNFIRTFSDQVGISPGKYMKTGK